MIKQMFFATNSCNEDHRLLNGDGATRVPLKCALEQKSNRHLKWRTSLDSLGRQSTVAATATAAVSPPTANAAVVAAVAVAAVAATELVHLMWLRRSRRRRCRRRRRARRCCHHHKLATSNTLGHLDVRDRRLPNLTKNQTKSPRSRTTSPRRSSQRRANPNRRFKQRRAHHATTNCCANLGTNSNHRSKQRRANSALRT